MNALPSTQQVLDNRGSNCAAGFVRLLEMMETLAPGGTLEILSTDPASQRELTDWAARAGHTILKAERTGPMWKREYRYLIRKGHSLSTPQEGDSV